MDPFYEPWILTKYFLDNIVTGDEGVWRRGAAMECCHGQAAMVRVDHVNSWWGVELLIPLLKILINFILW
jgi:hypothetical protein